MIEPVETDSVQNVQPLCPHEYWPWEYELASRREGWILSNDSDDGTTISRLDDPASVEPNLDFAEPKFTGDLEAQAFVIEQAAQGSRLHMLAIYLMGFPVDQPLNMRPPDCLLPAQTLAAGPTERTVNEIVRLKEYQFDLGDSTDGPIGLAAMIYAADKAEALGQLQAVLQENSIIKVYMGSSPADAIQYVNIYLSPNNISLDSVAEIELAGGSNIGGSPRSWRNRLASQVAS